MDIEKKLSSFERALDSMFKNLEDGKIVFPRNVSALVAFLGSGHGCSKDG